MAGDPQVLHVRDDLGQLLQGLLGVALILAKILLLAVKQVILLITADFQNDLPQVIGDLDDVLLHFDGPEVVVGKAADKTDGQDAGDQTDDHLLANVQMHGRLQPDLGRPRAAGILLLFPSTKNNWSGARRAAPWS